MILLLDHHQHLVAFLPHEVVEDVVSWPKAWVLLNETALKHLFCT